MNIVDQAKREIICNIGQVSAADKRLLDKATKRGDIAKWRGCWFPVPGAPFGLGPLKSCWGPKP